MTDTLAIEVTTKTTWLNPEQIKLSKMTKKNGPTAAEASNEERTKDKRLKFLKNKTN